MAYELTGEFLEACDCYVMCPCWFDDDPDEAHCTGLIAWYVDRGTVEGVDVGGLVVVSVSHHGGNRRKTKARVALFVDDRADDEQARVLEEAFTGQLGGPLGDLAGLTDEVDRVERARMTFTYDGETTKLKVGKSITTSMKVLTGSTDRVMTVADSMLATLLGSPAQVGRSTQYRLDLSDDDFDMDRRDGRSANRGRFAYNSRSRSRSRP